MPLNPSDLHRSLNSKFREFCHKAAPWKVLPARLYQSPWISLNLGKDNPRLTGSENAANKTALEDYIKERQILSDSLVAFGGWQEDRALYELSPHFDQSGNSRSVHLGIDLWVESGTEIICPYPATIHSFNNNRNFLDYGPTIILEHKISEELRFYSLYGHLSLDSLRGKQVEQEIKAGEILASLGKPTENGGWPPHLHFQIILDLLGHSGDFPGVSSHQDREFYRCICPDPGLLELVQL